MKRSNFQDGTSELHTFWYWIRERHTIYNVKSTGMPRPWTDDPILHEYKFTNVFRELDAGTIALRKMEKGHKDPGLILFNTVWYRMFNRKEHAERLGFLTDVETLERYARTTSPMFTNAHMLWGGKDKGTDKVELHLESIRWVFDNRNELVSFILEEPSIQNAFEVCKHNIVCCGPFLAYEIASDLRWSLIPDAHDKNMWANPGGGAVRGMRRLGFKPTIATMQELWTRAQVELAGSSVMRCHKPFELREIEHSLCEFDKYERARTGLGRPRMKYHG